MIQHLVIQPVVSCEEIYVALVQENIVVVEYFRLFVHPLVASSIYPKNSWCDTLKPRKDVTPLVAVCVETKDIQLTAGKANIVLYASSHAMRSFEATSGE